MSARDELKKVIAGYFGPTLKINAYKTPEQQDDELTDAILAAGYTKPRTITTAEELETLPVGSVIRRDDESDFSLYRKWSKLTWLFNEDNGLPASTYLLPAAVLYEPSA